MGTNTGVGIGIGIPFKNNALGGDRPYLPPELKARMIGVWDNYGKKNTDADRNIIKNKIPNAGGDLEILNSAYRLNSGFGGYSNDFQEYTYHENVVIKTDTNAVFNAGGQLLIPYPSLTKDVPSFKIKVSGLSNTYHFRYYYRDNNGVQHSINMAKDGNYELPICYNVQNSSDGTDCGFANNGSDIITVEILPAFEGALVTDGINDIIASIKTLEEWNIGDKGITIVSMIHQINTNTNNFITTNNIRTDNKIIGRNIVSNIEKTGIYGWYKENIQSDTINVINNILGDKNDYTSHSSPSTNINSINNSKFYVQGYAIENGFTELSSVAHYWTFAVLGKATEDEINLIIAKYNLDRTLNPDILCNTIKQGITNENHAEFGDKLIDYSGNGRDIQLNNIAWKGDSGIGKYVEDFTTWYVVSGVLRTSSKVELIDGFKHNWVINKKSGESTINSFKVLIKGIPESGYLQYRYFESEDATKISSMDIYEDGEYSLPNSILNNLNYLVGFQLISKTPPLDSQSFIGLTITQIPSNAGALCLDGINDFGKVTGMPIYKDYTFIIDYERISYASSEKWVAGVVSKSHVANQGAFILMTANTKVELGKQTYSFGGVTSFNRDDFTRALLYQSKYKCGDVDLTVGGGVDSDTLWLGTFRDNDQRFFNGAIYSLMSFPYSMSEFLIERQLKKHKLGTLYPNMVEFRPVIKANANYKITYYQIDSTNTWKSIKVGDYIVIGAKLAFQITFDNDASELKEVVSPQLSGIIVNKRPSNPGYNIYSYITSKSPQKINITIDEYIRYEDIVQPYPVLLRFNDENGNEVSWGGKFRVGSTITRIGGIADPESNLLNGLYSINGLTLNGKVVASSAHIVEKQMVFKTTATYLLDDNEPKCILSPRLLRIPNSSYKILGYIPDISGHGNHGKINNSAYAGMSGANGYVENFTTWGVYNGAILTDNTIKTNSNFNPANSWVAYKGVNTILNSFSVNITGIPEGGILNFRVNADTFIELSNGRNDLSFDNILITVSSGFRITKGSNLDWSNLVIQQIGEYEGAYCLDGVDDFVTIPTLSSGGKQVLMKVNWNSLNHVLYDQRNNAEAPFCIVTASGSIAYNQRNVGGNTFIDGILNNHILVADLQAITHNIVLNNDYNVANSNSFIGTNYTKSIYAKMSLYDFMLFDEISTDEEILTLNEYVGIEGNTDDLFTENN